MRDQLKEVASHHEGFLTTEEANKLFEHLMGFKNLTNMLEIETVSGEMFKYDFGKMMFLDKKLMEENRFDPSIWGSNSEWSHEVSILKKKIEELTGTEFQTCVCIYYPDGNSGVAYHSDYPAFGDTSLIPSLSLGEERDFLLREKETMIEDSIFMTHGSLVIMGEGCQDNFEHSLPVNGKYKNPRINLTFRKYGHESHKIS